MTWTCVQVGSKRKECAPMKRFRVIDSSKGLWAPICILKARSIERALAWCERNGYDLIEQV